MVFLPLDKGHVMYYETHGNPHGKPAVVLHGGPGGGLNRKQLAFFDLRKWFVVLYDQRGCGKSTPYGVDSLDHNTTADLLLDMERLRKHLEIKTWFISGGSWGSTLGLLYGEAYPKSVSGMLLRSVCLSEPYESAWLYEYNGAGSVFPDGWKRFSAILPAADKDKSWKTVTRRYQEKLTSRNKTVRRRAANAWSRWEDDVLTLIPGKKTKPDSEAIAILENHYFIHNSFIAPNQILNDAAALRHIPITVFHGRYDMICPFRSAWKLKDALPHIELIEVPDGGHTGYSSKVKRHMKTSIEKHFKNDA